MYAIQNITSDPAQIQTIVLPDGTSFTLQMEYKPLQYGWFIRSLTFGTFVLENMRICTSPNLLRQYRNQIPFGIAIFTTNNFEPTQQGDFENQYSNMFILTAADVAELEKLLNG